MPGQLSLFDLLPAPPAEAGRQVALIGGRPVEYRLARARRRTLAVTVDAEGLGMRVPMRTTRREIDAFLREHARWILARLEEWAKLPPPRTLHGVDGERLPLRGAEVVLEVCAGRADVRLDGGRLAIAAPRPWRRDRVLALLVGWLKRETLTALAPRAAHYAAQLGRPAPVLAISHARRQWGVCCEDGAIRLSWRLIQVDPALADYVVAHEVAHLVELNHSGRFWALVESLYPRWRDAREELERAGASLPRIGRP